MPYDIHAIRADFPSLHQDVHPGKPLVFLDSAASSQKPRQVIEAMRDYYNADHANVHRGVHTLSERATAAYEGARDILRDFINADSRKEIIFTRNTTEALNLVSQSWGRAHLTADDVVLLSELEHHSNLVPWQILQSQIGFTIRYIPVTESLTLDLDAYRAFLAEGNVKLVAVTGLSNVLGTVIPLAEMIPAAHEVGAIVAVDGAQLVPHMPVDVQTLDVDFLAFSGHKMCGPTGIGVLYGKRAHLDDMPPFLGGGDMIRRVTFEGSTWNDLPYKFEAGTPAIAEAIGLGAAAQYLQSLGLADIQAHEHDVTEYAHERLSEVPGLHLLAPPPDQRGGVATFTLRDAHPHDIAQMLDFAGVAVRAGHHCAMPLHDKLGITASSRASFYLYNTREEVDTLVDGLYQVAKTFA
ncbi:MAG: cysteine desulfurase [Anaerolineales bacterium]